MNRKEIQTSEQPTKPEKLGHFHDWHTHKHKKKWGGFQIYSSPTSEYMESTSSTLVPTKPAVNTPGSAVAPYRWSKPGNFHKRRFFVPLQVWYETSIYVIFTAYSRNCLIYYMWSMSLEILSWLTTSWGTSAGLCRTWWCHDLTAGHCHSQVNQQQPGV